MLSSEEDEGTSDRTLMYYVNDGVYGSFNCILYDHAHCLPTLHKVSDIQGLKKWHVCKVSHQGKVKQMIMVCVSLPSLSNNRSQSQMRSCTPAVSGAQHAMALIALLSSVTCLTCKWATGWFLITWVPTRWLPPPPSTASKDLTFTTSCPALPGE